MVGHADYFMKKWKNKSYFDQLINTVVRECIDAVVYEELKKDNNERKIIANTHKDKIILTESI